MSDTAKVAKAARATAKSIRDAVSVINGIGVHDKDHEAVAGLVATSWERFAFELERDQ